MILNKEFILGLTGPTGCGKTLASSFLCKNGFILIDADEIVKAFYLNCKDLIRKIDARFAGVVENGLINKKKLAKIVFTNKVDKAALERIVWPFVLTEIRHKIEKNSRFNIVIDAPLLFESGAFNFCNKTVAILSNKKNRFFRILKRDGISSTEALRRIKAQQPYSFYANKADFLIFNDGNKNNFLKKINFILTELKLKI